MAEQLERNLAAALPGITQAFADYWKLVRDRQVMSYAVAGGFFYAGMFAYVAGTPFAFITCYPGAVLRPALCHGYRGHHD